MLPRPKPYPNCSSSDVGVALVGNAVNHSDPGTRLVFERGVQGRIERAIGRQVGGSDAAIVYRYDGAGRLALTRSLYRR